MQTDIQYAIMQAAYAAWESDKPQQVEGFNILVIPDSVLAAQDAWLAAQAAHLEDSGMPKFWIEHEDRRAQIVWYIKPPLPKITEC